MRRVLLVVSLAAVASVSLLTGTGVRLTAATLSDQESVVGTASTAGCFTNDSGGPLINASVIAKTTPYVPGFVRQGGTYYVYANVPAGSGGPATRVTADVRSLTPGQHLAPLTYGSYSAGGISYEYRSAALTVTSPTPEGSTSYSISAATSSSICRTAAWSTTVDNTAPSASDVQPLNKVGGTSGRPEIGDTIVYTFSEPIDPETVLAGWIGTSTNVVLLITNSGANDVATIRNAANTAELAMGSVALGQNYVGANVTFGASGTASTMVMSGNTITVTLGTASAGVNTPGNANAAWTPSAAATDRAGNACSTTARTETGAGDRNF